MDTDDPLCALLLLETERVTHAALRAVALVASSRRGGLRAAAQALAVLDESEQHVASAATAVALDVRRSEAAAAVRCALRACASLPAAPETRRAWTRASAQEERDGAGAS